MNGMDATVSDVFLSNGTRFLREAAAGFLRNACSENGSVKNLSHFHAVAIECSWVFSFSTSFSVISFIFRQRHVLFNYKPDIIRKSVFRQQRIISGLRLHT